MGAAALTCIVAVPNATARGVADPLGSHHRVAKGWQEGGPLRPIYRSAVADIHARQFDAADALCRQGLKLSPGDPAFTDLLGQIPQWRSDSRQAQITAKYSEAVNLVHSGNFDAATQLCHEGLQMDPGNGSFRHLLRDIARGRHDRLEAKLVVCYKESSLLFDGPGSIQRS